MARPRIHLYMPCWNEEVLLPHFFRHYAFVERFVIFDNGSTDGTTALIAAEPRAEVRAFDTGGEIDERKYLRIKNEAWKESRGTADLVIVCDTDEFLHHPRIEALLARMKAEGGTVLKPAGYDMVGERPPAPAEDLLATVPDGARRYEFDKCMLFDPDAIEEIGYGVGAHTAAPKGRVRLFSRPDLALLHYKYLGIDYVRRRFEAMAARIGPFNRARRLAAGYTETRSQTVMRLRQMAHLAERVVRPPDAASAWDDAEPDDLDAVRAGALAALAAKDWHGARAGFGRVLAWRPGDVESLGNLATALRRLALETDAGWCFRQALSLAPDKFAIWFNYGNMLLAKRSAAQAAHCFESTLRLQPDLAAAWLQLGNARSETGDATGAETAWREAIARAPGFVAALRRLGNHLAAAGRAREAEPVLRAWAAAAPADAAAAAAHRAVSAALASPS